MTDYIELIKNSEDWLMNRILVYAEKLQFTRYTSTLAEAWRLSISGLSNSLILAVNHYSNNVPELSPDDKYISDPISEFGIIEAQKHRKRGTTLGMFLGLMKYYKESYIDLIEVSVKDEAKKHFYKNFTQRCFDRIEIAYCIEWTSHSGENLLNELQDSSRAMTNEKNKYLTIFESSYAPIILLDENLKISNLNQAAIELFTNLEVAGSIYYKESSSDLSFKKLNRQILQFLKKLPNETNFETQLTTNKGDLLFQVRLKKMQDVSKKFSGTVIMLDDITERKKAEFALGESETEFRNLVRDMQVGVLLQDSKSEILLSNPKALELLGITENQLLGKTSFDADWNIIHEDGSPFHGHSHPVPQAIATRKPVHDVIMGVYRPSIGDRVWLKVDAELQFNNDNSIKQVICTFIDITNRKKLEEALSKQINLFNTLLKNIHIGVYMVEVPSGKPLLANEASFTLLGRGILPEANSSTITKVYDLYKSDSDNPYPNEELPLVVAMSGVSKHVDDMVVVKPDGTKTTLEVFGSPVLDDKSNIWASLVSFQDITQRKHAELALKEREKEFRSLAESMPQIVWTTRADGWNTYFNQQWVDYTGLTLEESYGHGWNTPFHPEDKQRAWDAWQMAVNNKAEYSIECRIRCHDGSYQWWLIRGVPQIGAGGEIIKFFGTCTDIEKIKETEQALKASEKQLLHLNADKDRFISILGHDLKGPFNNILGLSEILFEDISNLKTAEIEVIARNINKSAISTNKLLEDILLWARTQQGSILFTPHDLSLSATCKIILEILNPVAHAKNITIFESSSSAISVYADPDMLKTILLNLVSNSIKFSNRGGKITINAEQNSENVTISVSDNGVGISADNLSKLFDISEVLSTKGTAGETGTGLGLLLSKEFVEKHGGKIWVESEAGKGSDFKFTLPLLLRQANDINK